MAIDRIGKGGGVPQAPETGGVQQKGGAERPFQVDRTNASSDVSAPREVDQANATSPLARLRAGEVDVHGYIDLKVDEATASLHGLSPGELDAIKKVLREQMASDPGLADLVRTATGQIPKPPED
jgi:hypothetical protein